MSEKKETPLIYTKLVEVMRDIGSIGKGQRNAQQGFNFRGIDDVMNALYPALTKHGVFIAPRILERKEEIRSVVRGNGKAGVDKHVSITISYTFYAQDGSSVAIATVGEGIDSGDKATNKALSSAFKYALLQAFSIPTADMEEADRTTLEMGSELKSEASAPESSESASLEAPEKEESTAKPAKSGFRKPVKKATASSSEMTDDAW